MDPATVRAAQCGDSEALAAVVDDFTPTVLGAAFGLCGDWDAAADIAQDAFTTMLVRFGDLRDPAAFPGWILAIVRSCARRHRERPRLAVAGDIDWTGPEDFAVERDEAERARLAIESLRADLRLPIVLHYFAGQPLAEISALLDLPISTVKQRMRVARARLRGGMDEMARETTERLRPDSGSNPSDTIRMYTAMRSGDVARVARILDERPDLVDVREEWTRAESFAHRLPWTRGGGTPLLRAVERGDAAMVRLLLARGADPNGRCTCAGGESPLWVAVLQHETAIVDLLLRHGADADGAAFAGRTALEVAEMRGYDDITSLLVAAGASPARDLPCTSPVDVPSSATGIKAIDLWCPLPDRGLVHLTPAFGVGAVVLVAELSYRAAATGRRVVWSGFVQAPTDFGDVHHALAESDLFDRVTVEMARPGAPMRDQVAVLDHGIAVAAGDALLVVFSETGRMQAVEERLVALAGRPGTTIVVAPLDDPGEPPRATGTAFLASIVFDQERAARGLWPAVSPRSWSRVAPHETATLAARARANPSALDEYLRQPFYVTEPVTGRPGESVSLDTLHAEVASLLDARPLGR